jgi:hypothetical protein
MIYYTHHRDKDAHHYVHVDVLSVQSEDQKICHIYHRNTEAPHDMGVDIHSECSVKKSGKILEYA